ncbi:RF-1 domain-containing protein [Phlyctochytrium arcticum]|nr:RF-1 domain-containing protein [Phlyctochytrium arcticum]
MPARQLITINEYDLHESFVKGSGPGGQKINKCRHRVQLKHIPTGILVESQRFRDLTSNRKEARKLLKLKLDHMVNGETSKVAIKRAKEVKRKKKQAQKAQKKYGTKNADEDNEELSGDSQQVGSEQSDTPKG